MENSPLVRSRTDWVIVLVGNRPGGELSWGGFVLVANRPNGEPSVWGIVTW